MSKSKTTHIICILDCSGSMTSLATEVVSNFNKFLKSQQELSGKAKLTLVTFDDEYNLIHNKVKLSKVKPITDEYVIGGMTALYDAVGKTITPMMKKDKVVLFVHTDGLENSSKEFTSDAVKALIKQKEDKWDIQFVGAGIDAVSAGGNLGFKVANCVSTTRSIDDLEDTYATLSANTVAYRTM